MEPPSAEDRAAWPDAFIPGKVAVVEYRGESCYAFAGEAEDFFPGEGLETEAELHDEAVLDAKSHFYELLSGGDSSSVVGLSGAFVAYRWADGPMRYVVCMVPVSAVSVTSPAAEEIMPPSATVPFAEKTNPADGYTNTIQPPIQTTQKKNNNKP